MYDNHADTHNVLLKRDLEIWDERKREYMKKERKKNGIRSTKHEKK